MAQIANLSEPVNINGLGLFQPIPIGPLYDVVTITAVGAGMTGVFSNRFPVPPSAAAFLTEIVKPDYETYDVDPIIAPPLVGTTTVLIGALFPESQYLEPTVGQIWPRTG